MQGAPPDESTGYITVAYGGEKYFQMALNLALSVRLHDAARTITLACPEDSPFIERMAGAFAKIVSLPNGHQVSGSLHKLSLFDLTPYQKTLFLDADCLIMKPDMERHWRNLSPHAFMIPGQKRTSGMLYGFDVAGMMAASNAPYIVAMNAGKIYFTQSPEARAVFDTVNELYERRPEAMTDMRAKRSGVCADQPFFGAAMGIHGIEPLAYRPEEGTIMATTYLAKDVDFDIEAGKARLKKATGYYLLNRFLAKGWVQHDSSIGHFIGLKPLQAYQRASDYLRTRYDVPLYSFAN